MDRSRMKSAVTALGVLATAGTVALGWVGVAQASGDVVKCQERKLKAQGKLQACLKKNSAKVLGGATDMSAACQTTFSDTLSKIGTVCRFLDHGDGTVTDLNTGLQWEKKGNLDGTANGSDPHDADNLYTWSSSGTDADGTAYTDFLPQLNNCESVDGTAISGGFAGHCDWRLPTSAELQTILLAPYPCASNPCIDSALGPTRPFFYWSATTWPTVPAEAWDVGFTDGSINLNGKAGGLSLRAVRGGL